LPIAGRVGHPYHLALAALREAITDDGPGVQDLPPGIYEPENSAS
jgi:hypothetical protein